MPNQRPIQPNQDSSSSSSSRHKHPRHHRKSSLRLRNHLPEVNHLLNDQVNCPDHQQHHYRTYHPSSKPHHHHHHHHRSSCHHHHHHRRESSGKSGPENDLKCKTYFIDPPEKLLPHQFYSDHEDDDHQLTRFELEHFGRNRSRRRKSDLRCRHGNQSSSPRHSRLKNDLKTLSTSDLLPPPSCPVDDDLVSTIEVEYPSSLQLEHFLQKLMAVTIDQDDQSQKNDLKIQEDGVKKVACVSEVPSPQVILSKPSSSGYDSNEDNDQQEECPSPAVTSGGSTTSKVTSGHSSKINKIPRAKDQTNDGQLKVTSSAIVSSLKRGHNLANSCPSSPSRHDPKKRESIMSTQSSHVKCSFFCCKLFGHRN